MISIWLCLIVCAVSGSIVFFSRHGAIVVTQRVVDYVSLHVDLHENWMSQADGLVRHSGKLFIVSKPLHRCLDTQQREAHTAISGQRCRLLLQSDQQNRKKSGPGEVCSLLEF